MSNIFEGNVCIITGSSSGIGLGLAKELLRRGAVVYMSGWRETNQENLQTTAELIAKYPQKAFSQELNVGDEKAVSEYKSGKQNAIMFLVGQVMKQMKGKADASMVRKSLEKAL